MGLFQLIDFYDNRCLKRVRSVENVAVYSNEGFTITKAGIYYFKLP